jgi:tRNA dimethylallyltransferase
MHRLIVIAGPTAVGKTGVALALAGKFPAEIINGDMGQLYKPLTIGTAKPDTSQTSVPHHLFDLLDAPVDCTVTQWRELVIEKVKEIASRNRTPILVGGSGFYLKSLFFPPEQESGALSEVEIEGDQSSLWKKLESVDPERARQLHPHDLYRIQRALSIWKQTGKLPSSLKPVFKPIFPFSCFVLMRDREELYQGIEQRTIQMIENGWIDEVKALERTEWEAFLLRKKIIGYDLILDFLRSDSSKAQLIAHIQQKTRNYAKRQITFFRSFCEQMQEALDETAFDGLCTTIQCTEKSEQEIVKEIEKHF